jgi:hypothetical protein
MKNKLHSSVFLPLAFFNLPDNSSIDIAEIIYSLSSSLDVDKITTAIIELSFEYNFIFILSALVLFALILLMKDPARQLADIQAILKAKRLQQEGEARDSLLKKLGYQKTLNKTLNTDYYIYHAT